MAHTVSLVNRTAFRLVNFVSFVFLTFKCLIILTSNFSIKVSSRLGLHHRVYRLTVYINKFPNSSQTKKSSQKNPRISVLSQGIIQLPVCRGQTQHPGKPASLQISCSFNLEASMIFLSSEFLFVFQKLSQSMTRCASFSSIQPRIKQPFNLQVPVCLWLWGKLPFNYLLSSNSSLCLLLKFRPFHHMELVQCNSLLTKKSRHTLKLMPSHDGQCYKQRGTQTTAKNSGEKPLSGSRCHRDHLPDGYCNSRLPLIFISCLIWAQTQLLHHVLRKQLKSMSQETSA